MITLSYARVPRRQTPNYANLHTFGSLLALGHYDMHYLRIELLIKLSLNRRSTNWSIWFICLFLLWYAQSVEETTTESVSWRLRNDVIAKHRLPNRWDITSEVGRSELLHHTWSPVASRATITQLNPSTRMIWMWNYTRLNSSRYSITHTLQTEFGNVNDHWSARQFH